MTLREFIGKLNELDSKWLDSELVVFADVDLQEFYRDPVVALTADSRVKNVKVMVFPGDYAEIEPYEDMFDDNDDNVSTDVKE